MTDLAALLERLDASSVLTAAQGGRLFSYDPQSAAYATHGWRSDAGDAEPSLVVVFKCVSGPLSRSKRRKSAQITPNRPHCGLCFNSLFCVTYRKVVNVAGFDVKPYDVDTLRLMLSTDGVTWEAYSENGQERVGGAGDSGAVRFHCLTCRGEASMS